MRVKTNTLLLPAFISMLVALTACEETKSYSELLTEEEHAVNWYLAQHEVALEIPADGNFVTGDKAPFYKMDNDGYVYMQVIDKGSHTDKPNKGDLVYFRFTRMNIKIFQSTGTEVWEGNSDDFDNYGNTSLIYGNNILTSTTKFGEGIQVPLEYLGYNSEVNLIVKSPEGFASEVSQCIPFVYNLRYFKAEY